MYESVVLDNIVEVDENKFSNLNLLNVNVVSSDEDIKTPDKNNKKLKIEEDFIQSDHYKYFLEQIIFFSNLALDRNYL